MAVDCVTELPKGGFSFENCLRNAYFASKGFPEPKARKTGTTIVGIVIKDGVILGADTRATEDTIVAEKNCEKIHYVAPHMYCCGAGTAADTQQVTAMISSQLALHQLDTDRIAPVAMANNMLKQYLFRYQGYVSAALILGGVDHSGPSVYTIHPHGSSSKLPYVTMGSGSLAAMSVCETMWKPDLSIEEGKKLVRDAIRSGIFNDMGSGSNVDLCVITKDGAQMLRTYEEASIKGEMQAKYHYKPGTTAVLSTTVIPLEVIETEVRPTEEMDVSG